ncbi:MAG: VCBS repeat-containing protein [Kiritimatiellae bacterium]|nr:VCBS repeat-containing protein [Kiritimatiellia bacterium]
MQRFVFIVSSLLIASIHAAEFERMAYNNAGLEVDLGVGLWAWPMPMDYDGDGDLDLLVSCPDTPYNGIYYFENLSKPSKLHKYSFGLLGSRVCKLPLFAAGKRLSAGFHNIAPSYVGDEVRIMINGREFKDYKVAGFDKPATIQGIKSNVHVNKVRGNVWRYVDYDGDGALDVVIGVGDWQGYGWANSYDENGVWQREPLHGYVYFVRNIGSTEKPEYDQPVMLEAAGQPIDVYGNPYPNFADFDGDGDLDLLCGEFMDGFTYFKNIGTRTAPKYAAGVWIKDASGAKVTMDLEMITPVALDWDGDGDIDLICGDEDGRVALVENSGKFDSAGTPIFKQPRYFRQQADKLKFGALVTPDAVDWDGDGDLDLICGNTAGYICFIENLSGQGVAKPRWAAPKYFKADGEILRIMAGENGSIQGPCERKWGYTTVKVADWDGDGLLDIVVNSIWGKVVWYRNSGKHGTLELEAARPIEVEWQGEQPSLAWGWLRPEGKALLTQWRTTPFATDWNGDGLVDLVMLDHQGYLALFQREKRGDKLVLLPPQRVFVDEQGEPLQLNSGSAGASGRRKFCLTDWDGDGKLDILANSKNVCLYRQFKAEDGKFFFKNEGDLSEQRLAGHTTSPTVADFNDDGIPELVCGGEDGYLYLLQNPRAK